MIYVGFFLFGLAWLLPARAEDGSWRVPLEKKAETFERNVLERHWIEGLYPSSVEVPWDGSPVDQTTAGSSNIAHSINWTSYYLGGQCYRYLFTKDEAVREHCNQIFRALYRCQQVTGVRGLQARGYFPGHGEAYEEREGSGKSNYWFQGVPPFEHYRWRDDPSHHNYSGAIYAFGMFYDLVAQGEEKDLCREAIDALVSYWADHDLILWDKRHERPVPILGFTDGKTPNTRILMAAAGLKVAHHATGQEKFAQAYEKLVTQYGFRTYWGPLGGADSFDDTNHVLQHLENLFRLETDEELRAFYRHVADQLWAAHRNDRQSLFTYIYYGLCPEAEGREQALQEALWTLRSYPTVKIFRPRLNSIRPDLQGVRRPLPLYESPWDNEYQWKGSLYQLDGWLSRPVVSVAVPAEDAFVVYAADTAGDIYQTRDGGKTWREISENFPDQARHLAAGPRVRMLYVAANGGFYKTTTAGTVWSRLPLPAGCGTPQGIFVDPANGNVLLVITDQGVYRSLDHGEEWIGERWACLTEDLPPAHRRQFQVGFGEPTLLYAVLDGAVWRKPAEGGKWERGGNLGIGEYAQTYPWLVVDPQSPLTLYSGFQSTYGEYAGSVLSVSHDGGVRWTNDLESLYEKFRQGGTAALMQGRIAHDLTALAVDPRDSRVLYAATPDGVLKSSDGGETWALQNEGLEIPRVQTIFAPATSPNVYVGTPAGLFVSRDQGATWENAHLVLIFRSNTRREVGSADYLDAYWRGRYFGFITPEEAAAEPETWEME